MDQSLITDAYQIKLLDCISQALENMSLLGESGED